MTEPRDLALRLPVTGIQLIEASAGTGKTFTVASLYARLVIECGLPVSRLLAVTFTEAATKDLRAQLRERLVAARALLLQADGEDALVEASADSGATRLGKQLLRAALAQEPRAALLGRLHRAVEQMDLAPIHTIHAFCQRALHEHALEAGQPLDARELLLNEAPLRREVALEFWRLHSRDAAQAQALLEVWSTPDKLSESLRELLALDGLSPAPRDDDDGSAERALRAARKHLAEQFDRHGEQARERLREAHAKGWVHATYCKDEAVDPVWAALRAWRRDPLERDPATDNLGNYSASKLTQRTNKKGRSKAELPVTPTSPLFEAIEAWALARAAADGVLANRKLALVHAARDFAATRMQRLKRERGLLGFDDMIRGVHSALEGEHGDDFARALQKQYAIALVDEFQDTDPRQWAIFRRLFAQAAPDDGDTPRALFLIGDPKQAIYRFRGGDVATYLVAQEQADAKYALERNFRSRPLALQAVQALFEFGGDDAFDQGGIQFESVLPGGRCPDEALLLDGRPAAGLVLQTLEPLPDEGGDFDRSMDAARSQAAWACAASIHALLQASAQGRASLTDKHGRHRAIAPGDISVLVPRNEDAGQIQQTLSALGIPSVAAGRSSLYQTREAWHVCWLLEAMLAPADDGRLRAVLASPLFGLDAGALAALDQDYAAHRQWQDRLQHWISRAERHGPMALLGDICAQQAPRLLGWPDGERRLSNYLQLAEDLQAAEASALGTSGLLAELERRIAEHDDRNDAELLRLESDAARVRIMTLHVSKGLTLDLVFLPYAATTPTTRKQGRPPLAVGRIELARIGHLWPAKDGEELKAEAREARAEHIRLLYVGLTRARLATWVGWGPIKGAQRTALGWLMHRLGREASDKSLPDDAVLERMQALCSLQPDAIAIAPPVDRAQARRLPRLALEQGAAPPPARIAQRVIDRDWWVYSFSQLRREDRGNDIGGGEERAAEDEIEAAPLERSPFVGSRFGNVLHAALERVDFSLWRDWSDPVLPPTGQLPILEKVLRDAGYSGEAELLEGIGLLTRLISATLNTAMPEGTRLAWLAPAQKLVEMEFHLALAPVQIEAMLKLLHEHGLVSARRGFGERKRIEGLLTGRIDLIYQAAGAYYVLDYKSNQLPDYGPDSVARAISEGEYDLQYLIYSLALHRWLRFRLGAAYDIRRHLGGVRYLFCRGLMPGDVARPGLHARQLPSALIEALDDLLGATAPVTA